ncbi:MAG: exodeoxyribonuclease VII large subunit [Candidatus Coprovivens sp.]
MNRHIKFFSILFIMLVLVAGAYIYKNSLIFSNEEDKFISSNENTNNQDKTINQDTLLISSITKENIGDSVIIIGEISRRYEHKNGHVFLTLSEDNKTIEVPVFADKNIETSNYTTGSMVKVKGEVREYQGKLQVIPEKTDDISLVKDTYTVEDIGKQVQVVGGITTKYAHPNGHLFIVLELDSGQELEVPLFSDLKPKSGDYPINSKIKVSGTIEEYENKLELIPTTIEDVEVLELGNDKNIQEIEISEITEKHRGDMIITEGLVTNLNVRNDGHIFLTLEKDGAAIKSVLFRADSEELEGRKQRIVNAEKAQFPIRVLGMIDIYNGELEVIIDKVLVD